MRAIGPNAKKLQKSNKLLNKYRSRFSGKPTINASNTSKSSVTITDPKVTSTMPTTSRLTNKTMTKNTHLKKISRLVSDSKLTGPETKNLFKRSTIVSSTSTSSLATLTTGDSKKTTTTAKSHIKKAASVSNIKHASSYMPPPVAKSKTTTRYQPPINRTTTTTASKQFKNASKKTQSSEILPRSTLMRQQIFDKIDNDKALTNEKQLTHEAVNIDERNGFRQEQQKFISLLSQRAIQCDNTSEQLSLCNNRFSFSSSFSSTSNSYNQYYPTSEPVNLFKSTRLEESNEEEDGDDDDDDNDDDDDDHLPFLSLSTATKNNDTISFLSQSQISINSQQPFILNKTNFQRSHLVENNDQLMDSIDEDL